ncbi:hypothetical protein GCM10010124_10640 [Pilimelia terevasa]|uniref:N,N-dimethylformamidase beta subunit-like C-terminal domain-containing protein n=1 Tax=Pilimelia terevasa TaxID=53372 RepID=A0A8J3BMI2_9ACTN|nr:N,N-dimethylformamidase beta subunit family domain-containing protein [Pilimelia terevasa]GGK19898.1 hypothetical protein GCM10010124_10640 [Pilimelia terevasa]
MSGIARRSALGLVGLGAAAGLTGAIAEAAPAARSRAIGRALPAPRRPGGALTANRIAVENTLPGTHNWAPSSFTMRVDDRHRQVQGYASRSSVDIGGSISFHVSVPSAERYTIEILRLGHYGGRGARRVHRTEPLPGFRRPVPVPAAGVGTIHCTWPVSWTLSVPRTWTSGTYLARFKTVSGWSSYHPFVIRDDARRADFCVVMPTATWQAYNQWPRDLRTGRNLYHGFDKLGRLDHTLRARRVSFDRPYHENGLPSRFQGDRHVISFLERNGYDVTYASSQDLHDGTLDASRYRGLLFIGHDEYWTAEMRARTTAALGAGSHLAYLTANNVYWHVRLDPSPEGVPGRTLTCYKNSLDPRAVAGGVSTSLWRDARRTGPQRPEQELIGVMYNGIVVAPSPLVVANSEHWFWAGTGLRDGDAIPRVVGGEADGFWPTGDAGPRRGRDPERRYPAPRIRPLEGDHTLLSHSRYRAHGARAPRIQSTSLRELPQGQLVFAAATLDWPAALSRPGVRDRRIERATHNVLDRMRDPV